MCVCVFVCVCVCSACLVSLYNPVKHLDNGGTAGLAFLHSSARLVDDWDPVDVQWIQMALEKKKSILWFCFLFFLSVCWSALHHLLCLPLVSTGAVVALVLQPYSWVNTGTDVVESLRGPLVPLVQQQGPGAAGEDFSNQFYWSSAIALKTTGSDSEPSSTPE